MARKKKKLDVDKRLDVLLNALEVKQKEKVLKDVEDLTMKSIQEKTKQSTTQRLRLKK